MNSGETDLSGMDFVDQYLEDVAVVLQSLDRDVLRQMIERLRELRSRNGRLFILGVGGSAANASHAVNDFRKISGLESYTPTDNVAELTARTNDDGWETSIDGWLRGSKLRSGDGIMVLSVGGGSSKTSTNLVAAMDFSKSVGSEIYAIVSRDGGHAAKVGDVVLLIPPQSEDTVTAMAESFQAVVWHLLATALARSNST